MPTSYWTALLFGLAAGSAITACSMYLLGFRRVRRGERTALVPEIDRTPLRQRFGWVHTLRAWLSRATGQPTTVMVLVAVMAAAVIYAQVQAALFTAHQRECNAEFRSTSLELRRIATEDRELENTDDALRNRRDDVLSDLVEALATPAPPGAVDARALLHEYNTTIAGIDVQRDQLIAERAALEQRRRAQPTPPERC
ncbi:hypothetical protein [Nocardia neocaledoniensis]|uniref:hypothetical protein n=1 Tax=Nocardia neocaledoniensis TaxID=236511 RepID=UPI0024553975|nr:hypothetical protein [Nocardia neocaledoniensis]